MVATPISEAPRSSPTNNWRYYANLVRVLAVRDIITRFRKSLLGLLWIFLRPIIFMLIVSVVRGIIRIPSDGIPYPLFSFAAITGWLMFIGVFSGTTSSIQRNGGILRKMRVPRILFPLSGVAVGIVEYAVSWLPMAGLLIWFGWSIDWHVLFVVVIVAWIVAFGLGLGLIVASFGIFRTDITLALPFLIQLWFFMTPVIYPVSRVPPEYLGLYSLNPMVGLIEGLRSVILRADWPDWSLMTPSLVALVVVWIVAVPLYNHRSKYFADAL